MDDAGSTLGAGTLVTIGDGVSGAGTLLILGSGAAGTTDAGEGAGAGASSVAFLTGVVVETLPDDLLVSEGIVFSTVAFALLLFRGGHSRFSFSSAFAASAVA